MRNFMLRYRSSFYCQICDFDNHYFFDTVNEIVRLNLGSCQGIAENTIHFIFQLNMKVVRPLWFLSKVIGPFLSQPIRELKVKNQKQLFAYIISCAKTFTSGSNSNPNACKNLCKYFNFNANSPVFEGYRVWFNDFYNLFKRFYHEIGHDYEKSLKERQLSQEAAKQKPQERKLSQAFTTEFLQNPPKFYEDTETNPILNKSFINQMINFNQDYEEDRELNYVNYVKNKYYYMDVSMNPNDPLDQGLFKIAAQNLVRLEDFTTKVSNFGIDLFKHIKYNNMDGTMKDMISHLKYKSRYKLFYEKLDPTLVHYLNDQTSEEIQEFHQDNYMYFRNYSDALVKDKLMFDMKDLEQKIKIGGYKIDTSKISP